jgi:DNA anti-recombination protein RmuC
VADDYARQTRGEADDYAERLRTEVDAHRDDVESRIDELVRSRTASLEQQVRTAVEAAVAETNERLQRTYAELTELRRQMADAAEGIHLAMLAMGDDPEAEARASVEDAVTLTIDLTGMPTSALGAI